MSEIKSTIDGSCAIAFAGAHAKGTADKESDIDFFMFVDKPKSFEERFNVIQAVSDVGTTTWVSC